MELDVRTALVLRHPSENKVLLLRRSPTKRLFPSLITGIGGKVELEDGEGRNLLDAMWREFREETQIPVSTISDVGLRLTTIISRGALQVLLCWFSGQLVTVPENLTCTEGRLEFHAVDKLPLDEMIPTARKAIPFILSLSRSDGRIYNGCFDGQGTLLTND